VKPRDRNLLDPSGDFDTGASDMTRIASELEIMRSDAMMLGVIKKEALVSDAEFGPRIGLLDRVLAFLQIRQPTPPDGDAALRRVLQNFERASAASQIGLSSIVSMSVRSADRNRAAQIANSWAQTYIDAQVSAKIDSTLNARNILQARLGQARAAMVAAEQSLDTYIDGNLARIVGETGRADVADLGGNLHDLLAEKNVLSGRFSQAEVGLRQKNWELLTNTLQSDALRELERQREQVAALSRKLPRALQSTCAPSWPASRNGWGGLPTRRSRTFVVLFPTINRAKPTFVSACVRRCCRVRCRPTCWVRSSRCSRAPSLVGSSTRR